MYDHLLGPEILTFALKHCDCIYIGKEAGKHVMAQGEIRRLMIKKAARFNMVVWLKGRDPCVFGRVGEEAQALAQTHVPFEIIPGISGGVGGLASTGIPITHRDYTSGARLVSTHDRAGTASDLDYVSVAHTRDTLIFRIGLQQLFAIASGLMQVGRNPDTPITFVNNTGHATQAMVTTALKNIEDRDLSAVVSPALTAVGEVINLQEELNFMRQRPLFQKHCLLPQFVDAKREPQLELQNLSVAVDRITAGGIYVNLTPLDDVDLQGIDILIFSSHNAIEIFSTQLMQHKQNVRQPSIVKIAVVGERSRQVLARYDVQTDIQSQQESNEHLAPELQKHISKNDRLVFVKADNDSHMLSEQLQEYAHVSLYEAYTAQELPFGLPRHVHSGALLTCSFHVRVCLGRLMGHRDAIRPKVYSMGVHTTGVLCSYGCQHVIELPKADKGLFGTCTIEEETYVQRKKTVKKPGYPFHDEGNGTDEKRLDISTVCCGRRKYIPGN